MATLTVGSAGNFLLGVGLGPHLTPEFWSSHSLKMSCELSNALTTPAEPGILWNMG